MVRTQIRVIFTFDISVSCNETIVCCYDCVSVSALCAVAALHCEQLLLPGRQGYSTETLRMQLEL